jgi:hypothetical protein
MNIKFARDGKVIGEYRDERVPTLLQQGVLRSNDFYWDVGMTKWAVVGSKWRLLPPFPKGNAESVNKVNEPKLMWRVRLPEAPAPIPETLPTLVWVICMVYFMSVGFTILSLVALFSGLLPVSEKLREYFQSLTIFDYALDIVVFTLSLAGMIHLFMLKKTAFSLLATALAMGVVLTIYQIVAKDLLATEGSLAVVAMFIGWGINIAVIEYSRRLIERGVLR